MNKFATFTAAATLAAFSTTATAGGLSPEIMETPMITQDAAPVGSSINPALVVVGVLAALLIASTLSNDDDSTPNGGPVPCAAAEPVC